MLRFFLSLFLIIGSNFIYADTIEQLKLEVIPYKKLIQGDLDALQILDKALHEKGIIGEKKNFRDPMALGQLII